MLARGAVALAALILAGSVPAAPAQTDIVGALPDVRAEVDAHRAELDAVTRDIALGQAREAELRREIDALDRDRASLNQALIDAGTEVKRLEAALDRSEQRLSALLAEEARLRASLASRRAVLAEVLATLQRMGDRPPPALLVRPEDALAAIRSAILLGAVVPSVRSAADQLAADLKRLVALRSDQQRERDRLKADTVALLDGRARIALLLEDKRRQRDSGTAALEQEQKLTADLATQATTLRDLVSRLELAKVEAAPPPPASGGRPRSLGPSDRLGPAVPFAETKGLLPMPANGRILTAFGAPNGLGGKAQGISLATRPGGEVVSPADGNVAYAGEFRSYGQLLIINAGGGYHVVLAGMERIDVQLGQFVLAGEPVAAMASQRLASAGATLVGTTEPVLYVEFRKDGASIDPAPWWAASNPEKVGG